MEPCPDCDPLILQERGDGKCRACYGSGKEQGLDAIGATFLGTDLPDCCICDGSGECQTCDGTGEVEDDEDDPESEEEDEEEGDDEDDY
jgi:hypothetical protein